MPVFNPAYSGVQDPCPVGPKGFRYFDDFITVGVSTTADAAQYLFDNNIVAATAVCTGGDEHGGVLLCNTDGGVGDSGSLRTNGTFVQTAATARRITFAARIKVEDADQDNFCIGLFPTGTENIIADTVVAGIGFKTAHVSGGSPILYYCNGNNSSENDTSTGYIMADDTWVEVAFVVTNRDRIDFYVNGALVGSTTTYIPTAMMMLFFQWLALDNGTDNFSIDYWEVTAER